MKSISMTSACDPAMERIGVGYEVIGLPWELFAAGRRSKLIGQRGRLIQSALLMRSAQPLAIRRDGLSTEPALLNLLYR
jgi:hypothetical protein